MSPRRADSAIRTQALTERLQASGLRRTVSRLAVLEQLTRASAPLSHAELADALASLSVDRATVYRNLVDLVDAKLVERTDLGDHVWRFVLLRDDAPVHGREHPHLVCIDCGTVVCRPDVRVELRARRALQPFEVQLRGRCDDCAA